MKMLGGHFDQSWVGGAVKIRVAAALAYLERGIEERDLFIITENIWSPQARLEGPEVDALMSSVGIRKLR